MATKLTEQEQKDTLKWPRELDIPIIEADVRNKKVWVTKWNELDLSKVDYEQELERGTYDKGIAIRCGKTLSGKHHVIGLDFDTHKALLTWFGSWKNVLLLAEKTLIEWHQDNNSIHVILLSEEPIVSRKFHVEGGQIEIHCEGTLLFVSPSVHGDGNKWIRLGSCDRPQILSKYHVLRLKSKIDLFLKGYMSDDDKHVYNRWLDDPNTILGIRHGRHDATKFKVCSYYNKYVDEWLYLSDEERFKRAWEWHLAHCKPPRGFSEFSKICEWAKKTFKHERDEKLAGIKRQMTPLNSTFLWKEKLRDGGKADQERHKDLQTISVAEALRIIPPATDDHTDVLKVGGVISSIRPVFKMVAGEYGKCPLCGALYHHHYDKPEFWNHGLIFPFCKRQDAQEHPVETVGVDKGKGRFVNDKGNEFIFKTDSEGKLVRRDVFLKMGAEYRNAIIVEIQDSDKFDDLEKLQVILFDTDTENVRAGEQITITGQIWIESVNPFSKSATKLGAWLYAHSMKYEARREISISNQDKEAMHRFLDSSKLGSWTIERFGKSPIDRLISMFAPDVIGHYNIKRGLLICAASCANDYKSSKRFTRRIRMHAFLIGDPGSAKSLLLRQIVKVVPNSRYESGQNSTGKSLTAIVSKEGGDNSILRLGPVPFAKEGLCAINEMGRMNLDDQAPLLDVMEEGEFTINKYGINAHIRSPTVILGSANPTSNTALRSEKITLDDIPALKPMIDRFDFIFVTRTSRDSYTIREYAYAKSTLGKKEAIPSYDAYLEKHLLYCKRFNPTISDEAEVILNEYYVSVQVRVGSPRVLDTLYKTARMLTRLKLKNVVDGEDAQEACNFYNTMLTEWEEIVNIPVNPRDFTATECLYMLEAENKSISWDDLLDKVRFKDDYIARYVGSKPARENKKTRGVLEIILNNSHVKRVGLKPVVLEWVTEPKVEPQTSDASYAPYAPSEKEVVQNIPGTENEESKEKTDARGKKSRTHRTQRTHRSPRQPKPIEGKAIKFDINKVQIVNLMQEQCDICIARSWLVPKHSQLHRPLAGMSFYLGNPFAILKPGEEPTKPWHGRTREGALARFKEWLYHGTEVVNGRDPKEYRKFALSELRGHYKWGCYCAPEKCHGDILKSWLRLKLRLQRRYHKEEL